MTIHLTKQAEHMLRYAVHAQPELEVGGFGKLEQNDQGDWFVSDILIPPQEVGSAALDLGSAGFEWAMLELAKRGETMNQWRCWWHSHSTMSPNPSSTDTTTLGEFADMLTPAWAIGLVTNVKGEYYAWLNTKQEPWPLVQNDIDVLTMPEPDVPVWKEIIDEMMARVRKKTYGPAPSGALVKRTGGGSGVIYRGAGMHGLADDEWSQFYGMDDDYVVWCSQHGEWEDECEDKPHSGETGKFCPHIPDCGQRPCLSKKQRKRRNRELEGASR